MKAFDNLKLHVRQFNWLTAMAILCVAVTSGFIMWMSHELTHVLSSPDWCARAIKAEQITAARDASSCVDLLKLQISALAIDNHIHTGTLALALLVLIVVVIAKARLDLEVAKTGAKAKIGRDNGEAEAAEEVADAAVDKAEEIKAEVKPEGGADGPRGD